MLGELGGWKANEKIKGSCFLFVCLVSRKWIEKGGEREREWKSMEHKFGVQCATEISAAAARTCGSPSYFYTIFFKSSKFFFSKIKKNEREAMLLPSSLSMTPEQDG